MENGATYNQEDNTYTLSGAEYSRLMDFEIESLAWQNKFDKMEKDRDNWKKKYEI